MTKKRFVDFLQANVFNKYKNHLIILDNVWSHNNEYVKQLQIVVINIYLQSLILLKLIILKIGLIKLNIIWN